MKRCPNSNCESSFLFGDDKTVCPFCHSRLINSTTAADGQYLPSTNRINIPQIQNETVEFVRRHMGSIECHGRITEIDHHELFYSKRHKMFNTIIRGEPYQFAHQTFEYTIRVENITDGISIEVMDFCLYGNYMGRLQVGDEVIVNARNLRDRRVIKSIYNQTTSSSVRPGLQIPAVFFRGIIGLITLVTVALVCQLVRLFQAGVILAGLTAVIVAIMPSVIIIAGIWFMFRSIFPKRRGRR